MLLIALQQLLSISASNPANPSPSLQPPSVLPNFSPLSDLSFLLSLKIPTWGEFRALQNISWHLNWAWKQVIQICNGALEQLHKHRYLFWNFCRAQFLSLIDIHSWLVPLPKVWLFQFMLNFYQDQKIVNRVKCVIASRLCISSMDFYLS